MPQQLQAVKAKTSSNGGKCAWPAMIRGWRRERKTKFCLWFGYSFTKIISVHERSLGGNSEK